MTKHNIKNKSQVPSTKFQINPVTDEMENNCVSNGVNSKFQLQNDQNKYVLVIGILVIGAYLGFGI